MQNFHLKFIRTAISLVMVVSFSWNQFCAYSLAGTLQETAKPAMTEGNSTDTSKIVNQKNQVQVINLSASKNPDVTFSVDFVGPLPFTVSPITDQMKSYVSDLKSKFPGYKVSIQVVTPNQWHPNGLMLVVENKDVANAQNGELLIAAFSIDENLNTHIVQLWSKGFTGPNGLLGPDIATFESGLKSMPYGAEDLVSMVVQMKLESYTTGSDGTKYVNFLYKGEKWKTYKSNGVNMINKRRSQDVIDWQTQLQNSLGSNYKVTVNPDKNTPFSYTLTITNNAANASGDLLSVSMHFLNNGHNTPSLARAVASLAAASSPNLEFSTLSIVFQNMPGLDTTVLLQGLQLLNPTDLLNLVINTQIESLTVGADGTSYINIITNDHDCWKIYIKNGQVKIDARLPVIIRNYRDDLRKALISGYDVTINFSSAPGQYTVLITPSQAPASGELSNITFNVYENSNSVSIDFSTLKAFYQDISQAIDPNLLIAGIFVVDPSELYSLTKITVLKVNDDESVVCVYKNKNYKIYKDSEGVVQIIEIAINVQDAIKKLIDEGVFTAEEYRAFVGNLSFEQIYSLFNQDQNEFMQFIIDNGFLRDDITTVEGLKVKLLAKGIDVDEWDLTADGILSAIQDVRGEGNLFKTFSTNPLSSNQAYREAIEDSFNASRENFLNGSNADFTFLNNLSIPSVLELLGVTEEGVVIQQEIYGMLWNNQPNPDLDYLLNQPKLVWDKERGYFRVASDTTPFTPEEAAAYLATLPEGQRSLLLTGSLYGDISSYDVLKDANGNILVDQNGKPYFFPTMDGFIQQINARIGDWFNQLAVALQAYNAAHGTNIQLDSVSLDYERKDTCYWYFRQQFDTNPDPKVANYDFSPLLKDPRLDQILQAVGITREQLLDMGNWNVADARYAYAYKWDAYFYTAREQGIYDAFFKPIVDAMPNVQVYNYSSFLHNNISPADWYSNVINSASNIGYLFENGIPCVTVYGVPRIIKTIEYPYGIPGSDEISMFERLIGNFDQLSTVDSTTNRQVAVWVSTPNVMANYLKDGVNMGNSMAEVWYRAGISAYNLNIWNSTADGGTPEQKAADMLFANNTLKEINEVMGYSDREILRDAEGVNLNGEKVNVGPQFYDFEHTDYLIYGVKANSQNVYRVTLNLGKPHAVNAREAEVIDDGSVSGVVRLQVADGKILTIENAHIYHPSVEVSLEGFWIMQNPDTGNLTASTESQSQKVKSLLPHDRRDDEEKFP